ncbi:PREDICTED: tectonin-1-like [Priapulus caudatus]|uniref:Tectonin-1-like n=1 Tax=Priapulus caudatus TaxID=37621 RepID=A0ABM1DN51_PRICU|nr:PREDICTED: tectonin-1-like [Priapulus caudatus]
MGGEPASSVRERLTHAQPQQRELSITRKKNGGSAGSDWKFMGTVFTHVSSGNNSLWGVNNAGAIYHRSGISDATPYGTRWDRVAGSLLQVSVNSVNNEVWGINANSVVYRRRGITATNHMGTSWQAIDFIEAKWVSVGQAGVWTTSNTNEVFYRTGTGNGVGGEGIDDTHGNGTEWQRVPGSLTQVSVSSASNYVWGLNGQSVYRRMF